MPLALPHAFFVFSDLYELYVAWCSAPTGSIAPAFHSQQKRSVFRAWCQAVALPLLFLSENICIWISVSE